MEEVKPNQKMKKEYEEAHKFDIVAGRPARLEGLQSAAAAALDGKICKLLKKDPETERWTVELVNGEHKSIKEANLTVSIEIDKDWDMEEAQYFMKNPDAWCEHNNNKEK